jgi:hypothetical protein
VNRPLNIKLGHEPIMRVARMAVHEIAPIPWYLISTVSTTTPWLKIVGRLELRWQI